VKELFEREVGKWRRFAESASGVLIGSVLTTKKVSRNLSEELARNGG
jgi:hypothetical protein